MLIQYSPMTSLQAGADKQAPHWNSSAVCAAVAAVGPAQPALAVPKSIVPIKDDVKLLLVKAKSLRGAARQGAAARRNLPLDPTPGVNNYGALTENIRRAKVSTLIPLVAELKAIAKAAGEQQLLPADLQKQLELQPALLQGHMLELDQALSEFQFEAYMSKRTGKTYNGGKVERELEEIEETCDDFVMLARGKPIQAEKAD